MDCTRGFINGNIEDVTVLIGMSISSTAHFGIIGSPFKKVRGKVFYDPTVTFGSIGCRKTYEYSPHHIEHWREIVPKTREKLIRVRGSNQLRVVTSSKRQNDVQNGII